MRKSVKALLLVVVSLLGSMGLTIAAAFSAALAFGAVALVVPGTGTPNANIVDDYLEQARDRYLQNTACGGGGCTDADLIGINYPASFFPLIVIPSWCRSGPQGCDKWDESVGQGVDGGPLGPGLSSALTDALAAPGTAGERDIVIFGYSQGGAVVSKLLRDYDWQAGEKERVEVVTIGGIENPDGGLWQRLAFLRYIPFFDITFDPPMPVDPAIKTTTFGFQYDPVVNAPRYWGNPLALLNAAAALETVHGYYLSPNGNGPDDTLPYGYDDVSLAAQLNCTTHPGNCRYDDAGNAYVTIPATSLPMYDVVLDQIPASFKPFIEPLVKLVTPVTKLFVDLGYDSSGNPGVPTPLSILPFNPLAINPITFPVQVVQAIVQGVQDAIGGGSATPAPAPTALQARAREARSTPTHEDAAPVAAVDAAAPSASSTDAAETPKEKIEPVEKGVEKKNVEKKNVEKNGVDAGAVAVKDVAEQTPDTSKPKDVTDTATAPSTKPAANAAEAAADTARERAAADAAGKDKSAVGDDKPAASDGTSPATGDPSTGRKAAA